MHFTETKNMDITIVSEMTEILDNCAYELLVNQHSAPQISFAEVPNHDVFKDASQEMKFLKA